MPPESFSFSEFVSPELAGAGLGVSPLASEPVLGAGELIVGELSAGLVDPDAESELAGVSAVGACAPESEVESGAFSVF